MLAFDLSPYSLEAATRVSGDQQREGLLFEVAGPNELWRETGPLKSDWLRAKDGAIDYCERVANGAVC